jgi:3-hydroxyisobutyrate dehydrogenase-like beta-hydroxyacid dehydrogenase
MNIGFIGVGTMGRVMILRLMAAGHHVWAWNRSPQALADLEGVIALTDPALAFEQEVVISMLADDRAVRQVLLSSDALARAGKGCIHIVMSTLSPSLINELQDSHEQAGIELVAAPMFGVPAAVAQGEANILASGAADAIEKIQPLLDVLGKKTWRMGDRPVQACIAKIAGNMMITQAIESLGEATRLVEAYGLPPSAFVETVTQTLFACPSYQRYGHYVANCVHEPGFKLSLGLKDVDLALRAAEAVALELPAARVVRAGMSAAITHGLGDRDWSAFATIEQPRPLDTQPIRYRGNTMTIEMLAARLEALESRAAIESLISGYANAYDLMDIDLLRSLWHADATLELPDFGVGRNLEEIAAMAHTSWIKLPHMHHWMSNPMIQIQGTMATATVAADCLFHDREKGPVQVSGLYHDRFERRDDQWRFSARRFELHFLTPLLNWTPIAGSETFERA